MDVLGNQRVHVEGREEDDGEPGDVEIGVTGSGNVTLGNATVGTTTVGSLVTNISTTGASTVSIGNTGTSAFGTVNVGRGATAVNIGDNVATAITLGRSTGTVTLGPPLILGNTPGFEQASGATGTFANNNLGYGIRINTNALTISNYNANNSLASIKVSTDGVYLATWAVQIQITGAPTDFTTNFAITSSVTSTAGTIGYSNWGYTKLNAILYGSAGSVVVQIGAGSFCNIILTMAGTSGVSPPAVTYCLTRIG